MSRIGWQIKFMRLLATVPLGAACVGCIVVPTHTSTKTTSATIEEARKKVDLTFVRLGVTGREEVAQKLGWIDTGVKNEGYFLGRWAESSWGVAVAMAGGPSMTGGWKRHWVTKNLLLDFDDKGVVQRISLFADADLIRTLSARVSQDPVHPLDLSKPIEIPVEYIRAGNFVRGTLVLERDTFAFLVDREDLSKQRYTFKTPRENITTLTMHNADSWSEPGSGNLMQTFHFKKKTAVGNQITLFANEPTLVVLIKYIAH